MNSYITLSDPISDRIVGELVVIPGRRKFWKWVDFGFTDSDRAVIVTKVKPSGSAPIDLIVWLTLALLHNITDILIVVNNIDDQAESVVQEFESCIRRDFASVITDNSIRCNLVRLSPQPTDSETTFFEEKFKALCEPIATPKEDSPFHLSINSIHCKDDSVIVGGKILGGSIKVDEILTLLPAGITLEATSLHVVNNTSVVSASIGEVVGLKLDGISREHIETGMILCKNPSDLNGTTTRSFVADVNFFNTKFPIKEGFCPAISIHCYQTLAKIVGMDKSIASLGDTVRCSFSLNKTAFVQVHASGKVLPFSRVVLRQENIVIGVGVIRGVS